VPTSQPLFCALWLPSLRISVTSRSAMLQANGSGCRMEEMNSSARSIDNNNGMRGRHPNTRRAAHRRAPLAGQVKRDGGDDDLRQRPERPPEPGRSAVMEGAVPPVPDHDYRENHGERQVGPLAVQ
jgi:hypothetical protein